MDEDKQPGNVPDVRALVRDAIQEFLNLEQAKAEPAYKAELVEERKRREQLEHRVNDLVEENRRTKTAAEEADRASTIRSELHRFGVGKVELAYRAVRDEIMRGEDGRLVGRTASGELPVREYLTQFLNENPELLPARISGGSGAGPAPKLPVKTSAGIDLDRIRPGMSADELEKVRGEISRLAGIEPRSV